MNKSRLCLFLAALLICSTFALVGASASKHHNRNQHGKQNQTDLLISIDQNEGDLFTESLNLSGFSNIPPTELSWQILDVAGDNGTKVVIESSYFSEIQFNDDTWNWYINETIDDIVCTCIFEIIDFHESNTTNMGADITTHISTIIYLGDIVHNPYLVPRENYQNQISNTQSVFGYELIFPNLMTESIFSEIDNQSSFVAKVCLLNQYVCVSETQNIVLEFTNNQHSFFSVILNQSTLGLQDGIWKFEIQYLDPFLRLSNPHEQIVTFDSNPPVATMFGQQSANEMETKVYSLTVDDGYIGSKVSATWTIYVPNQGIRSLNQDEIIDESTISIIFDESGEWIISVLVMDSAGHYLRENLSVIVENLEPNLLIQADGLILENDDVIKFKNRENIILDAGLSTDTENDQDSLIYMWYLDGELLSNNMTIFDTDLPEGVNSYYITLKVLDDNDAFSELSFLIEIQDDADKKSSKLFIGIFVIILLTTPLVIIIARKKTSEDSGFTMPRWRN